MNREKHFHPLAALHLLRKTLLVYLLPPTAVGCAAAAPR